MLFGSLVNLYSSTSVEPQVSTQDLQDDPVGEYVVPEMTYKFNTTGVLPQQLKMKREALVEVMPNVFHPTLVNGRVFVAKAHTRRLENGAGVDSNWKEVTIFQYIELSSILISMSSKLSAASFLFVSYLLEQFLRDEDRHWRSRQ